MRKNYFSAGVIGIWKALSEWVVKVGPLTTLKKHLEYDKMEGFWKMGLAQTGT